jgi:PAS domain S-box-containing protein
MRRSEPDTLREKIEARLSRMPMSETPARSIEELQHELMVHQIELEMQNDDLRRAQVILEESRDRYLDLYNFAPVGYLTLNRNGMIEEINLTGAALLGLERNKLIHRRFALFVASEYGELWHQHFMLAIQRSEQQSFELPLKRGDGSFFHARLDCRHVEADSVSSVRITLSDISGHKRDEQESAELLHRYQMLMKTSIDGIHIMDIDGNLLEANDAFCRMLGYTQEEVRHLNVTDWVATLTTEELRSAFKKDFGNPKVIESLHRRKDGTLLDVEVSVSNIKLNGHFCVFASSRDITERKRLESELLQTTIRLRDLVAQSESAQEAERKSIAREVHDELGQILSTLRLNISMTRMRFGKHDPELMWRIQNMTGLVDRAIHGARNVSENLHPAVLGMGIIIAIKWLCDNFAAHTGISCVLDSPDQYVDFEETRAVVIFRIVQESLTNVMRHAHARNVKIVISLCDDNLCMEVRDDGRGFDMNGSKRQASYGLLGMHERARACGGHLDIASAAGKGTVISFRIPISAGAAK